MCTNMYVQITGNLAVWKLHIAPQGWNGLLWARSLEFSFSNLSCQDMTEKLTLIPTAAASSSPYLCAAMKEFNRIQLHPDSSVLWLYVASLHIKWRDCVAGLLHLLYSQVSHWDCLIYIASFCWWEVNVFYPFLCTLLYVLLCCF